MKGPEYTTAEWPTIQFLKELKYQSIVSTELRDQREDGYSVILKSQLLSALQLINNIDEDTANAVYQDLLRIVDNESWAKVLRGNYSRMISEEATKRTIWLIDFKNPKNNIFSVATQFRVQSQQPRKPDIVVFVNGIPVVVIEAKKPVPKKDKNNEAIEQILQYERDISRLFLSNVFNIVTDGVTVLYGATGAKPKYWGFWRDPWPKSRKDFVDDEFKIGLYSLLEPNRLLDIIAHFTIFERDPKSQRVIKKICRYHQFRAVNKMVERVEQGKLDKGLIWHTQGSGKSLTMVFAALKLKHNMLASGSGLENPNLCVITDRKQLDEQIGNTFVACGMENPSRVGSINELHKSMRGASRGSTLISTIHKFQGSKTPIDNSDRWIVLVDECHRTQEEDLGAFLRATFPKSTFFGFTGTPVKKNDKNTYENFGVKGEGYLDRYSIDDAVADGATVPIHYTSRMTKWQIDPTKIDVLFDQWFGNEAPELVVAIKKRGVTQDILAKHHQRVDLITEDIWAHFREYAKPDQLKAQIVAFDREAIILYKRALDRKISKTLMTQGKSEAQAIAEAATYSACVYSTNQEDAKDSSDERIQALRLDLRKHYLDEKIETATRNAFTDTLGAPYFLIVCDKLLTGFDAPIEGVMYLDSPLTDHNLLQAIARTNRVWDNGDKSCGLIVDYIGVSKRLDSALAAYRKEDVATAMRDMDSLALGLQVAHRDLLKLVPASISRKADNARTEFLKLCEHLGSLDQWLEFKRLLAAFRDAYSTLCPDPRVLEFREDFKWFMSFLSFGVFQFEKRESLDLSTFSAKVRQMVEEHLNVTGITTICQLKKITDPDFWDDFTLASKKKAPDDDVKIAATRKSAELRKAVAERVEKNEIRYQKFSELVEAAIKKYEENIISAAELLGDLEKTARDLETEDAAYQKTGLTERAYDIFKILLAFKCQASDTEAKESAEKHATDESDEDVSEKTRVTMIDLSKNIEAVYSSDDHAPSGWQNKEQLRKELRQKVRELVHPANIRNWKEVPEKVEEYALRRFIKE